MIVELRSLKGVVDYVQPIKEYLCFFFQNDTSMIIMHVQKLGRGIRPMKTLVIGTRVLKRKKKKIECSIQFREIQVP